MQQQSSVILSKLTLMWMLNHVLPNTINFFFKYRPTLFTWKSVLRFYAMGGCMNITINSNGVTQMAVGCSDGAL